MTSSKDVRLKLIDLQSDTVLSEHFKSVSLLDFYSSLKRNLLLFFEKWQNHEHFVHNSFCGC